MRVLGVSYRGNLCGLLSHVARNADECRLFVHTDPEGEMLRGIVPQVMSWRQHVDWADLILLDHPSFWEEDALLSSVQVPIFSYGHNMQDLWRSRKHAIKVVDRQVQPWKGAVPPLRVMWPIGVNGPLGFAVSRAVSGKLFRYSLLGQENRLRQLIEEKYQPIFKAISMCRYQGFMTIDLAVNMSKGTLKHTVDLYQPEVYDMVEAAVSLTGIGSTDLLRWMLGQSIGRVPDMPDGLTCFGAGIQAQTLDKCPDSVLFIIGGQLDEQSNLKWLENEHAVRVYTNLAGKEALETAVNMEIAGHA